MPVFQSLIQRTAVSEDVLDDGLKKLILQLGPCGSGGSFEYIKKVEAASANLVLDIIINTHIESISVPRLWLCF